MVYSILREKVENMSKKKNDTTDPFSLFGQNDSGNDIYDEDWDPFGEALENLDDDSANSTEDPFVPASFSSSEVPVQHRRTTSSPMRILSPQPVYNHGSLSPQQFSQLPNTMSANDFYSSGAVSRVMNFSTMRNSNASANVAQNMAPTMPPMSPASSVAMNMQQNMNMNPNMNQMNMNMRMPPRHYMIPRPMMNMGMGMNMGMALRQTISADFNTDEARFYAVCADPSLIFNPARLGFIPPNLWEDRNMTFGECVSEFFQRKNNANSRFSHKLFNALRLSEFNPIFTPFVGVKWINENILRVDKRAFARLLGIKSIDGSLFHQQGNFPSHGFFEIGAGDVSRYCPPGLDLTGVDFENVRLLIHTANLFKRGCTEADIEHCRWASTRK